MHGRSIRVHASVEDAAADLATAGLAGYAFQDAAWLGAYQDTLGAAAGIRPAIAVVSEDGRVRMVLPLAISSRGGIRTLAFLGGRVTDYNAPLVDPAFAATLDAAAMDGLWREIQAVLPPHDVVRLLRMPDRLDPPAGCIDAVPNPLALLAGARSGKLARSLALTGSHEAIMASRRKSFVGDTRRQWRRLAEQGTVALTVAEDAATMERVFSALKPMKSRRWRDTGDRDHFADPAVSAFYQRVAAMDLPEGRVHGSLLTVGETAIAAHLGLVQRDRFYCLMIGWEAGPWQRFGTGRLLTDALVRWSCENGLTVFDFTVGDEVYKRDWVDTELPLFGYEAATTARGWAALSAAATARNLRAGAKRMTWLRNTVRRLNGRPPIVEPPGREPAGRRKDDAA